MKTQYPDNVVPVIQSQPSPIAELLSGSGTVLAQTVDALNRINRVMSDDNIRSFSSSVKNVEALTAELEARKGMFQQLEETITKANAAVGEYQALGVSARQMIDGDGKQAIANINAATREAQAAIASINRSATGLEGPLGDFGTQTVPQLNDTIRQLDQATRSLQSLVGDVRKPARFHRQGAVQGNRGAAVIRSSLLIAAASVALSGGLAGCALLASPDPVQLYRFGGASAYAGTGATSACPDVHVSMRRVDFPGPRAATASWR